jgi:hypothetical protein
MSAVQADIPPVSVRGESSADLPAGERLGVMLYLLGLTWGAISLALEALGVYMGKIGIQILSSITSSYQHKAGV